MIKPAKNLLAACAALFLVACGGEDEDQKPPVEGLQLTDRLFISMENKDYGAAVQQYRKLLESHSDEFASVAVGLRPIIETNQTIFKVQRLIDAGKLDDALAAARDAKQLEPANEQISDLLRQLVYVDSLRRAAYSVRSAATSRELAASLDSLNGLIAEDPKAAPLKRFSEVGAARLAAMRKAEERNGRFDLLAEYYQMNAVSDWLAPIVQAECEYELRNSRLDPLPEVVVNELYPRTR
ncbi:MAG: hypothetical protein AB7F40_05730 [Victivallaceae bacterium]|nr:hypothetical protein [Victivallaceae bacterium]